MMFYYLTILGEYLPLIYPNELEAKDTTDTQKSTSYLDLQIEIDNGGRLKTKLYDKWDDLTFPIINFPFIGSYIPASPAYGVNISQLIGYSRACTQYSGFLDRTQLLMQKLPNQGYVAPTLKSSLQKLYVVIAIWLTVTKYPYLKWQWIFYFLHIFFFSLSLPILLPNLTLYMENTAGVL